ncbi:HK97-gp10 family putative phage morphogenesis protein [Brochothrix campestris]|uniref:HK97 gp10 family phage protein n=1 Tax=Brochothrix campestris FSL F6-1037 TaxID=1265861 RepID=W7CEP2_9LIST|nr:HK97-gp10 family putative phage morphogenesis protein [Brochothrix campestris]EUJ34271.1 HK97 gp10 family phage protein [Brochothrix campestris FSL F6-1037]
MGVTIKNDIGVSLRKMAQGLTRPTNKALNAGAEVFAERLEKNTPVFDNTKYKGKRGDYMFKHAKDNVTYGTPKNGEILIGFKKDVAWRVHFVEFGTIRQAPKPFIQKTQKQASSEVFKVMLNEMSKGLKQ